ncbi:glycosyltransferase EpsF [Bacillus niacini]|uniref:Glycosyltransferase EpsF n=1 Tax=Neobacillus niacini TaxID=86668 RepID=A0A852T7R8_9BACI|nr:glycosyltransferase [Neobacillus niacini]NYE03859.1 glycosyltransferase EpsF [Neobacillus niacini]
MSTEREKIKVLHVVGTMNTGGAEIMLMDIYRNISANVEFDFLVNVKANKDLPKGDFDEEIIKRGGRLLYVTAQWDLGITRFIKAFKQIIKENGKPDILHVHLNSKGGVIALCARLCKIKKIIVHSHADINYRGSLLKVLPHLIELKFQKILISLFATDLWACSRPAAKSLFFPWIEKKAVIINNAINVSSFLEVSNDTRTKIRESIKAFDNKIVIGNVGRINRSKNIGFLIEIMKILKEKEVDCILVCAGRIDDEQYMNEVKWQIEKFGLQEQVVFLGNRNDIQNVLSSFDIFVSPSRHEGFGMVAAEAQASGLPCVLSDGFPKNVDMGLNLVEFMDDFNAEEWAETIMDKLNSKILDKEKIYKKLAELGFDVVENTKRVEELYYS